MSVSVIIPTLNEAENIGAVVEAVRRARPAEVIVVDGGSTDATAQIARQAGATVVISPRGRGAQQRVGAEHARGEELLFLHADTKLPANYPDVVAQILSRPHVAGGAFRFKLDGPGARFRWIERLVAWRCRMFELPYGDQAIFVRADVLRIIGGYPALPIMEDYELVRRLKKVGSIEVAESAAVTSARRWRRLGALNAAVTNMGCVVAYKLGVSAETIARRRRT
ncbi:MAG: TIGR04283 family arsenosugar biosynthesis glycosyltransferase [Acidobacteria bacterium]|nr:TIGR04283 family arsenosugar biosynthesis glycosyltransferase [Acidobacteriota bacterium]